MLASLRRSPALVVLLLITLVMFFAVLFFGGLAATPKANAATTDPPIAHCINDDYNDGTQDVCYTVRSDGQIILIDKTDTIVADMSSEASLKTCAFYGYVGSWCKTAVPTSQSNTGQLVQSPGGSKYYSK